MYAHLGKIGLHAVRFGLPSVVVIGAGSIGRAIAQSTDQENYRIVGLFDAERAGQTGGGLVVRDTTSLPSVVKAFKCKTAVLAVPSGEAQKAAELCVNSGIDSIINYTACPLEVPRSVVVSNVLRYTQELVREHALGGGPSNNKPPTTTVSASRFISEFECLDCLGRGGFGSVYRVSHRLDGSQYAVKTMILNRSVGDAHNSKCVREVRILAKVSNHPNIVRYYYAWMEPLTAELRATFQLHDKASDTKESTLADSEEGSPSVTLSPPPAKGKGSGRLPVANGLLLLNHQPKLNQSNKGNKLKRTKGRRLSAKRTHLPAFSFSPPGPRGMGSCGEAEETESKQSKLKESDDDLSAIELASFPSVRLDSAGTAREEMRSPLASGEERDNEEEDGDRSRSGGEGERKVEARKASDAESESDRSRASSNNTFNSNPSRPNGPSKPSRVAPLASSSVSQSKCNSHIDSNSSSNSSVNQSDASSRNSSKNIKSNNDESEADSSGGESRSEDDKKSIKSVVSSIKSENESSRSESCRSQSQSREVSRSVSGSSRGVSLSPCPRPQRKKSPIRNNTPARTTKLFNSYNQGGSKKKPIVGGSQLAVAAIAVGKGRVEGQNKKSSAATSPGAPKSVLFIQMELCESSTLEEWMKPAMSALVLSSSSSSSSSSPSLPSRHPWEDMSGEEKLAIFAQIVHGLHHVHASGFIHRDIKPSNLFLFNDSASPSGFVVKIGDFGLSADHALDPTGNDEDAVAKGITSNHTTGVGTVTYAPPEQLQQIRLSGQMSTRAIKREPAKKSPNNKAKGKPPRNTSSKNKAGAAAYDHKVDMYSLGVVLFEMFAAPFSTMMERMAMFTGLRNGSLPTAILSRAPVVAELILTLTARNPSNRPDAATVLRHPLLSPSPSWYQSPLSLAHPPLAYSMSPLRLALPSPAFAHHYHNHHHFNHNNHNHNQNSDHHLDHSLHRLGTPDYHHPHPHHHHHRHPSYTHPMSPPHSHFPQSSPPELHMPQLQLHSEEQAPILGPSYPTLASPAFRVANLTTRSPQPFLQSTICNPTEQPLFLDSPLFSGRRPEMSPQASDHPSALDAVVVSSLPGRSPPQTRVMHRMPSVGFAGTSTCTMTMDVLSEMENDVTVEEPKVAVQHPVTTTFKVPVNRVATPSITPLGRSGGFGFVSAGLGFAFASPHTRKQPPAHHNLNSHIQQDEVDDEDPTFPEMPVPSMPVPIPSMPVPIPRARPTYNRPGSRSSTSGSPFKIGSPMKHASPLEVSAMALGTGLGMSLLPPALDRTVSEEPVHGPSAATAPIPTRGRSLPRSISDLSTESNVVGLKQQLLEKDHIIASLRAQLGQTRGGTPLSTSPADATASGPSPATSHTFVSPYPSRDFVVSRPAYPHELFF